MTTDTTKTEPEPEAPFYFKRSVVTSSGQEYSMPLYLKWTDGDRLSGDAKFGDVLACLEANPQLRAAVLEGLGLTQLKAQLEEAERVDRGRLEHIGNLIRKLEADQASAATQLTELQQLYAAFEGSGHSPKNPREAAQAIAQLKDDGADVTAIVDARVAELAKAAAESIGETSYGWAMGKLAEAAGAGKASG